MSKMFDYINEEIKSYLGESRPERGAKLVSSMPYSAAKAAADKATKSAMQLTKQSDPYARIAHMDAEVAQFAAARRAKQDDDTSAEQAHMKQMAMHKKEADKMKKA